jgi:hypothetical protein
METPRMADLHQQIVDLEAEIDFLSEAAEGCRKRMIVAKVAIAAGALLFGASILGLIRPDPTVLFLGIAAALAGIGFFGSNRSTLQEISGKIRAYEVRRARMIDGMDLRGVQDG